ncbi:hypothetical protein PAPYR_11096 [Paratrimastix pyriformis]|uniref:Uncharacterized protein n=1 Tax=Paratrimastix pyriformis TaxID=342808 RepID=A0ABQ8U4J8_9EUKA|nr:hypothetical protein PAPYR_11096 [Paratrimastix pyriformis]
MPVPAEREAAFYAMSTRFTIQLPAHAKVKTALRRIFPSATCQLLAGTAGCGAFASAVQFFLPRRDSKLARKVATAYLVLLKKNQPLQDDVTGHLCYRGMKLRKAKSSSLVNISIILTLC